MGEHRRSNELSLQLRDGVCAGGSPYLWSVLFKELTEGSSGGGVLGKEPQIVARHAQEGGEEGGARRHGQLLDRFNVRVERAQPL